MWRDSDFPDEWRDYDQKPRSPSGTGSASLQTLTQEEADAAQARKKPIGFRAAHEDWRKLPTTLAEAIESSVRRQAESNAQDLERRVASLGECVWTARDIIHIETSSFGSRVVVEARCLTS